MIDGTNVNKMGWTNYLWIEKENVALQIGKVDGTEDNDEAIDDLFEYMNEEDGKVEVIKYLWNKLGVYNPDELLIAMLSHYYGGEIISEERLSELEGVRVIDWN